MYKIFFTNQACKDIEKLKAANLSQKAKRLVDVLRDNPFQNPPQYEKLVGNLQGLYSRRINIQHRLVYQVIQEQVEIDGQTYDGTIKIIRAWTHYER